MIIVISVIFVVGFVWLIAKGGDKPPAQPHEPVAVAVHAAHVNMPPEPSYKIDSAALVKQFQRIESKIKARTDTIRQLRAENDSLFCEVVNAEMMDR